MMVVPAWTAARSGGDLTVDRFRVLLIAGAIVVGLFGGAAPAPAKDPRVKQAKEQMEFGYKAARRGYWQEALDRFETADELTPNQVRILNNIAVALEANGRFDEARTTYRAALALDPSNRSVRRNLERFEEFYGSYAATGEEDADRDGVEGGDDDDAGGGHDAG